MKTEREIPDNLGCYAVVKDGAAPIILGKGEWGAVYKTFNSKLRCFAALRIVPQGVFATEEAKQKFSADVRKATYIMGHRSLAAVFPLESTEDTYLYGAELCNGEKLVDRIQRDGCLPAEAALNVARQIAQALETIGKAGLQHQRITARNIMLDEGEDENDLRVKVLDLALPRAKSSESSADSPLECDFRSPEEKIAGSTIDSRAAVYTVGAVLYYLLAGSEKYLSFRPGSSADQDNLPADSTNLTAGCVAILEKTLRHDPALRLQSLPDLRELLEQVIDSPESFEAAKRDAAQRRVQEEEDAKRRVQEEAEAARRAKEQEEARQRAQEESAKRRAQEEQEAAQRKVQEEEAARKRTQEQEVQRRAQEEEEARVKAREQEAQRQSQEQQAKRRAREEEEAQRKAEEEEAARKKSLEQEAQRKAQKESARRAAEADKPPLGKLLADQHQKNSKQKPKSRNVVIREAAEEVPAGSSSSSWGWVVGVGVLVLGGLAGLYFWSANPPQTKVVEQPVKPTPPVVQNPPVVQPSPVAPSPQPAPIVPVPPAPQPVRATSGNLAIDTDPTGGHVTLDGRLPQTVPYIFANVSFGKHHFAAERDGYKHRELDLPFDGSPLPPIHLEPLPDPFQGLVDRMKAAPHDSPDYFRASVDYLQQVKTQPPSRQLDPVKIQQDLFSALLDLEKKMISLPQYHHRDVYKGLLENKVLQDAEVMDSVPAVSVPATVMLADNEFGADDTKALELFKSAALKNDRYAMRMLGKLYEQAQDAERSSEWLNKASAAGDAYAHVLQLHNTLRSKKNDDPTAKPAALKELESDVDGWEKAVAAGDSSTDLPTLGRAEYVLGSYEYERYQNSQKQAAGADETDPAQYHQMAADLFKKSTDHGEPLGYLGLGTMALGDHDLDQAKAQFAKGAVESPACSKALAKLNQ